MVTIKDLRGDKPSFTQWEVDRALVISGTELQPQLHFANHELSRALVVLAEESDDSWVCKIPNFMLQFCGPMFISVCIEENGELHEICKVCYMVAARLKPQDYTFTENIGYTNWVQKSEEAEELLEQMRVALIMNVTDAEAGIMYFTIDENGDLIYSRDPSRPFQFALINGVLTRNLGHVTAYGYAKAGGYTGTEAEFEALMAGYADAAGYAQAAANSAAAAANSVTAAGNKVKDAQAWAEGKRGSTDVPISDPAYHNNAKYYAGKAAESATEAETAAAAAAVSEDYARAFNGAPLCAAQSTDMTDTDRIYVYVGAVGHTEPGFTIGHWYYYLDANNTWVDGGTYQSAGVTVDPTLTLHGVPADAKAVGDALAAAGGGGGGGGGGGLTFNDIYPIGSIYISMSSADPALLFGGTWTRIENCFLLAASDPNGETVKYRAGDDGGNEEVLLVDDNIPPHGHFIKSNFSNQYPDVGIYTSSNLTWGNSGTRTKVASCVSGNDPNTESLFTTDLAYPEVTVPVDIMPPYLAVYMWQRTGLA